MSTEICAASPSSGKAAYDDRNFGNGKTVVFYDFALPDDAAANYVLSAQPASATANITQKELTIADLRVKDKQYEGKNTAEIEGTPTLVGVVDGDVLTLVNGVPTFDSVKIGKNIPVSFTAFTLSGDRVTVANYTLTQPSGITANIVEYVADGSTYYVTKKVAIDDENLELVTLNGKSVKDVFTLAGDKESAYIIRAVDKAGNLTESERAALGRGDALAEKIKKLAEDENSPKTEDTSNLALWIALLFINGGIVTGTTVVSKKKRRSEN